MLRKIAVFITVPFIFAYIAIPLFADGPSYEYLVNEIKLLKEKVAELEKKVSEYEKSQISTENVREEVKKSLISYEPGEGVKVEPAGLAIGASGTFVFQGTPNANNSIDGEDSVFDASYKANIDIMKEFGDWGLAFAELEAGENDSIESELSVFSNVDRAASDTGAHVDVNKLWYEHYLFNRRFTITAGKMEAADYMDQNEYAYDECAQFLGHMFRNSPVIEFPDGNGPGLRAILCLGSVKCLELSGGIFEADSDWDDIFDRMFYMAQLNFKPTLVFGADEKQWDGNYRFYFWVNDRCHEKLVGAGEVTDKTKQTNYGLGISCDQMITDVFGVFGRFGWQRPDIFPAGVTAADVAGNPTLEWAWSAGIQVTGQYWSRPDDAIGFAIGQVFPGNEWDNASSDTHGRGEGHIETYYRFQLNECISLSPDLQVIWNPYGIGKSSEGDGDTMFIYGMRGQLDF
ncbi:MAG: hypothetical protein A2Z72_03175 [Omnitrophica bacterium RBG_13_46_9]|nr:MAG: hypothetical protein A2Z72_03175 [Omnitrophica bacterium RBG_13_46_9]